MDIEELNEQVGEALDEPDLARAAQLLERAAGDEVLQEDQPVIAGLWEELADAYAERGRHDDALAAIRRCLELEYDADHDLRGTLAVHLLRAGREDEADELWELVANEQPDEVTLRFMAGIAYQDLGRHDDALGWFDEALEMVLAHGDHEGWLADLLQARDEALGDTAQQPDDLQQRGDALLAHQLRHVRGFDPVAERRTPQTDHAIGWFPEEQWQRAVQLWPQLRDEWDADEYQPYARQVQRQLLEADGDAQPLLAPIYVEAYLEWCDAKSVDAGEPSAVGDYAAEVARVGNAVPWPPRRGEPCWCGSGQKYKKCCGTVSLDSV